MIILVLSHAIAAVRPAHATLPSAFPVRSPSTCCLAVTCFDGEYDNYIGQHQLEQEKIHSVAAGMR